MLYLDVEVKVEEVTEEEVKEEEVKEEEVTEEATIENVFDSSNEVEPMAGGCSNWSAWDIGRPYCDDNSKCGVLRQDPTNLKRYILKENVFQLMEIIIPK